MTPDIDAEMSAPVCVTVSGECRPVVADVLTAAGDVVIDCHAQRIEVATEESRVEVFERGMPGPSGPPGPPGSLESPIFRAVAGETIHGGRAVRIVDGVAYRPRISEAAHAAEVGGIAVQAGVEGEAVQVRALGSISDPAWSWTPGFIYCGDDGVLTQSPASAGWLLPVARSRDAHTLDVAIGFPVMRS